MGLAEVVQNLIPNINAGKMQHDYILSTAKRWSAENLHPALERIGPENLDYLIHKGQPFHETLPPQAQQMIAENAKKYGWALRALSDNDLLSLLPGWVVTLVGASEEGKNWIQAELDWLRIQAGLIVEYKPVRRA